MEENINTTYKSCGIDDIKSFYKDKFAHDRSYDINNEQNYQYDILNLKQMYIYDYIKPSSKILDFGCGSGIFKILKNLNCYLVGVDLSHQAIKNAKELNSYDEAYALDIFDPFFDKFKGYFDYIISSDVFGHIEFMDKDKVIKKLKEFLTPNGTMIHGIETGDIRYYEMTQKQRFDFVSVDGHVGMESEEKTTNRFKKFFKFVNTYTPYGIVNDLDEIIKQHESYDVAYLDKELINYLKQKRDDKNFKYVFNLSQYCTHKAYEANTKANTFLNLYGFSFLVASNQEIAKYDNPKPEFIKQPPKKTTQKSIKIAIIAPSPIPFTVGGAEKLWWGMQEYINKHTQHQCELIKVPTKENSFWDLIDSYYTFYKLDLSHFDMLISTKYPAWMSRHKNHHIYLQHCLRGLYDTYHFTKLPFEVNSTHPKVKQALEIINDSLSTIDDIFNILFTLRNDASIPKDLFLFPAPFIRVIIHALDQKAMQDVKYFSAISQTVIDRKEYFPPNTIVEKLYHPSNLSDFKNNSYDYFFTASRLDSAKRVEMILKAYMASSTDIPFKIAGTGPLEAKLKDIAKDDPRIEFLGFISDEELLMHYANAYAVIFTPYDEDYGLITIEAFMSSKPVITFYDAGGVVEFVEHDVTGLLSNPDIKELAKNINYISLDKDKCRQMGQEALKRVQNITWKNTIESILSHKETSKNKKITVVTTYGIYPPRGGGQNRIYYLYKEIAKSMIVDIVCLVNENEPYKKTEVAKNLFEIRVPKTKLHAKKEFDMAMAAGIPITDIAMLTFYNDTPRFVEEILQSAKNANAVITSHPYTYPLLEEHLQDTPIIHESHNLEFELKKQMLKDTPYNQKLLQKLFEVEKKAYKNSFLTTVCSHEDAKMFEEVYGYKHPNIAIVPNGVDLSTVHFVSKEQKEAIKNSLSLQNTKIVLFIGSWHQPNIEAVEEIIKLSSKLPDYNFIVIGSVGNYFAARTVPQNIAFSGMVDDEEKQIYLNIADIAINPMFSGSGTNLKMLDYMAAGIPVLSTEVGARGLDIPSGYIAVADISKFDSIIKEIDKFTDVDSSNAYARQNFSWEVIQKSFKIKDCRG